MRVSIAAILVLGRDLTIRRFTPLAEKAFSLVSADLGRPLGGVRYALFMSTEAPREATGDKLGRPLDLEDMAREVIDTVSVRDLHAAAAASSDLGAGPMFGCHETLSPTGALAPGGKQAFQRIANNLTFAAVP
jgi:hypothetical protein